ncbi:MAG: hypothetical protein ACPGWS_06040 [Solirubrobacterales bacterium]
MTVPPDLRSPLSTDDFDAGFAVVRKLARMVLVYVVAATVVIAVLKPSTLPFAIAAAALAVMIYATVMARLRQRFDAANEEIAARGNRPFSPGDFSDDDEWR